MGRVPVSLLRVTWLDVCVCDFLRTYSSKTLIVGRAYGYVARPLIMIPIFETPVNCR